MGTNLSRNQGDSASDRVHPTRLRRILPLEWLSMEPVNADQSDITSIHVEQQGNCKSPNTNVQCPRPAKKQGHFTSFCIPVPSFTDGGQIRPRSKSFHVSEADQLRKRSRKSCLSRWKLVENIIPIIGYKHSARRNSTDLTSDQVSRLNTVLLETIENHINNDVERILNAGANPNATCRAGHISACHVAAYANSDALQLLLKFDAKKDRRDRFGRTPLHLAAWAGENLSIAMLLDFPNDLQKKVQTGVSTEVEEEIKTLSAVLGWSMIDVTCELAVNTVLQPIWKDSIEHKCRKYMTQLPKFFSGWTPLHVASYAAHHEATRLLLAAGANPNSKDAMGRTPLDIAGAAWYLDSSRVHVDEYVNTIKTLIKFGGKLDVLGTTPSDSALHMAVALRSVEGIQVLLAAGAPIWHLNSKGNTPLHECVEKSCKESLQELAKHCIIGQSHLSIDVVNSSGYTVLHAAIFTSWVFGVCVALEAGANVTFEARDGITALHIAALKGNFDILDEILLNAARYAALHEGDGTATIDHAVNYSKDYTEPPIFCAIRSGNIECVQALLDAGAILKMSCYVDPSGITITPTYAIHKKMQNMILHAAAEVGGVNMLEILFEHDKNLEELLNLKCLNLEAMIPVEFAAYHNRFDTFRFLLHKTLERSHKLKEAFDHSRLLHIIATLDRENLFTELIRQIPEAVRTGNAREKNEKIYYPLHDVAKNSNRNMIVQLIHNGADLSEVDDRGRSAISLVINNISKPTEFLAKVLDNYIKQSSNINTDSEISIDYRVLIPTTVDKWANKEQLRVLTTFLETVGRQNRCCRKLLAHPLIESFLYLKWKTLSTYFFLMVVLYSLFVISISVYTMSVFYYKDQYNETMIEQHNVVPYLLNPYNWQYMVYITLGIVLIQELSRINVAPKAWVMKVISVEFWVKFLAFSFAIATSSVISMKSTIVSEQIDWPRHLATITLVMAWLNITMMLSKTPKWGYYVHMFWIVSSKVFKILITFMCLIIMFSSCFMIQFHSQEPFDGPWAAFVKTFVMMTSEFDYSQTFSTAVAKNLSTSIQILRLAFVIFMILTAIVMMNLMIGVAVHDVQYLVEDGNLKRLEKQVAFLNNLEVSREKSFFNFFGLYRWFKYDDVPLTVKIKPVNARECCYSTRIQEAIINKAKEQLDRSDREAESNKLESKFDKLSKDLSKSLESKLEKFSQDILRQMSEIKSK